MEGLDHDWVITNERASNLWRGRIDEEFLTRHITDFSQHFYLCGPDKMVADLRAILERLGAKPDAVTFEK
jgi:propane monooxygenase reductase subunit